MPATPRTSLNRNTTFTYVNVCYFYFINSFSVSMYLLCMRKKWIPKKNIWFAVFFPARPIMCALIFIFNVKILLNVIAHTHSYAHIYALGPCVECIELVKCYDETAFKSVIRGDVCMVHPIYVWSSCPSPTTWTAHTNKQTTKKNENAPDELLSFLFFSFICNNIFSSSFSYANLQWKNDPKKLQIK